MVFGVGKASAQASKGAPVGPVIPTFASDAAVDTTPSTTYRDIATDGSTIVAVGGVNGTPTTICRYSTDDGATWNNATITAGHPLEHIEYANGLFVACGDHGGFSIPPHLFTSTDGQTWTERTLTGIANLDLITALHYSVLHSLWMIAVTGAGDVPAMWTSPDGTTAWTERSLPDPASANGDYTLDIVENDTECFITGGGFDGGFGLEGNWLWKTVNGTTWTGPFDEGLSQTESLGLMVYVPNEDTFVIWSGSNDIDKHLNNAGFPGTQSTIDDAAANSPAGGKLKLNSAGGVFCAYVGTTGISTTDGNVTNTRYQVDSGSGVIRAMIQHKLQYFAAGFNGSNGTIYELEE
jgi:hypothetical protein